jgi:hypothetical protein
VIDRATFELIKQKHGGYGSWAVWADAAGSPKSNIGDLSVLDPDRNPALLPSLRNDVVMVGLNLSRPVSVPLANFHDSRSQGQDYKVRFAFAGTPYYGAYMTDIIKGVVVPKASELRRYLRTHRSVLDESLADLFTEFADLRCASPTLITFGADAYRLAAEHIPRDRYSRLVKVRHYSDYMSQEAYRARVADELGH